MNKLLLILLALVMSAVIVVVSYFGYLILVGEVAVPQAFSAVCVFALAGLLAGATVIVIYGSLESKS